MNLLPLLVLGHPYPPAPDMGAPGSQPFWLDWITPPAFLMAG